MPFIKLGFLVVVAISLLASCAMQPIPNAVEAPGFWFGLLHGFISPFALISELFTDTRIYAFPNNGGWYDLGFMVGVGAIAGGGGSQVA